MHTHSRTVRPNWSIVLYLAEVRECVETETTDPAIIIILITEDD